MQKTTLKITKGNGKVLSDMGLILPCALEELGCETTSPDPNAYIWDYLDNCMLSVLRTEEVNLVKQNAKYYVISGKDYTSKVVFEVKKIHKNIAGSPRLLIRQTTIRFIWPDLVKVSTRTLGETLAARRMVQLKIFNFGTQCEK